MSSTGTAPDPAVLTLSDDDLNGECFILGAEGEVEELIEKNEVIFAPGTPTAAEGTVGTKVAFSNEQANEFILINVAHSVAAGRNARDAAIVAYIRFLAARNGLISPDFSTAGHNVRYNHAVRVSAQDAERLVGEITSNREGRDALIATLTEGAKKNCRKFFSDIVCCVAYIFRVRGHHYRDDILDRYSSLWARCLHKDAELPVSWELLATDALHAIMPDVLDGYWRGCVENARCAGALIKRFDSAPAGVAGVLALQRGVADVQMTFPAIFDTVPDAASAFREVVDQVSTSRWGGSINCRFYGVRRIRVDEGKIGALASVVMGIYEQLAPDSKLRDSPALRRLAEAAPATGGAIGMAARRAIQDERLSLIGSTVGQLPAARAPE
jgi:hypothetical protein